jgi:formate-dependent nitrite reductase membrane component NrfD
MLYYVLIGLSLALTGVAGMQMMYMFYLDRLDKERKKRVIELERNAAASHAVSRCRAKNCRTGRSDRFALRGRQ